MAIIAINNEDRNTLIEIVIITYVKDYFICLLYKLPAENDVCWFTLAIMKTCLIVFYCSKDILQQSTGEHNVTVRVVTIKLASNR